MALITIFSFFGMLVLCIIILILFRIGLHLFLGQKTHSPQRRMYGGRSASPTTQESQEPTIYVSPANLPPPPKYELMAPPSYEEVVGMSYPYSGNQNQPINQPLAFAVALQNSDVAPVHSLPNYQTAIQINDSENNVTNEHVTVVTVSNERRSSAPIVT